MGSVNRRLQILKHWLLGRKNGVGFPELIKAVIDKTCGPKALLKIRSIDETDEHIVVYFHDFDYPLYYPKSFDITSLYQVITESFYPDNWHYYEIEQTKVGSSDIAVDCGAAEGLFSLLVAKRCNKIYAIEPVPKFIESMNLTFAGFDNVEILPVALSDQGGEATITGSDISSVLGGSGNGTRVKVTTLDALFFDKNIPLSYIKVDLEGYDFTALKGASNIIKTHAPKIAITTYHKKEHAGLISDYLRDINPNYRIKTKGIEERFGMPVMLHAWVE